MAAKKWTDIKREAGITAEDQAEIDKWVAAETVAINLRAIRELVGMTQAELAAAADKAQSLISKIESRDDHRISTLRAYIEGLGGELEVRAVIGDRTVKLHGV